MKRFKFALSSAFLLFAALQVHAQSAPNVNGTVYAVAAQPDGKVVLAGTFNNVNNQQAENIARINADGSLDTQFPAGGSSNGIYGTVYAVAVGPDGSIVAGGEFNRAGTTRALNIVRYLPDGSVDAAFAAKGGINGPVYAITVLADGRIAAGGEFTMAGEEPAQNFALLNSDGSLASAAVEHFPVGTVRGVTSSSASGSPVVATGGAFQIPASAARNLALFPAGE